MEDLISFLGEDAQPRSLAFETFECIAAHLVLGFVLLILSIAVPRITKEGGKGKGGYTLYMNGATSSSLLTWKSQLKSPS
jgi:hypothetical protein